MTMPDRKYRVVRSVTTYNPIERTPQIVPIGPTARAVRVVRTGHPPVVLPLATNREYQLGRSEKADLYFGEESVSRLHGFLYFSVEAFSWTFRDTGSINGSFIYRSNSGPKERLPFGVLTGIIAGYRLQLGESGLNCLEFLAEVPPDALGSSVANAWKSPAARKLEEQVQTASQHALPLFLLGPSGTGKTFVANRIHQLSRRAGDYVDINCGQLTSDRVHLASELVGHVKGAFTGAIEAREGKLFQADRGTLFLDEVESLVPEAQVFLLNLLEGKGDLTPLGATASKRRPRPKFRLMSASKKRLEESDLRKDLAQRLASEIIIVPSLADRREDIPTFIALALEELAAEQQVNAELSQDAMAFLMDQPWPGQVRELLTTVRIVAFRRLANQVREGLEHERLVLGLQEFRAYLDERREAFGGGHVAEGHPASPSIDVVPAAAQPGVGGKRPRDLTRDDVESALRGTQGNKTHAAQALGIAINTLKKKMSELDL